MELKVLLTATEQARRRQHACCRRSEVQHVDAGSISMTLEQPDKVEGMGVLMMLHSLKRHGHTMSSIPKLHML